MQKQTKKALVLSVLSLVLCVSMLVGTTFAWFTDSVTTGVNTIQSGTLDIVLEYYDGTEWVNAEGKTLNFLTADGRTTDILWEPGCTYQLPKLRLQNNGNLALKYNFVVNGVDGDAKLLEVIDWKANDKDLTNFAGTLLDKGDKSIEIVIKGHMLETAGNEYQNLTIEGIGITVFATQMTEEFDSFGNQYDKNAAWDGTVPTAKPDTLVVDTTKKLISINDPAAFAYLNTLVNDPDFYNLYGSKWQYSIELNTDVNLLGQEWTPIMLRNFVAFDGNGHTISNLKVSTGNHAGLFGAVTCNDIGVTYFRNLNLDGAYVQGEKYVGAVIGAGTQAAVENVTVNNATVIGVKYVGGIFGSGNGSVNNSSVKNSEIRIPASGEKEAGGLIGYLSNDGAASTENKVISGNLVENVTVVAPTVASGLISQPNSSNIGGALIVIEKNALKNVQVITADTTAALEVSNNVNDKSIVRDNDIDDDCEAIVGITDSNEFIEALEAGNGVVFSNDVKINPAGMSNAYGTTGINVEKGQTIDGGGNILDIKGAGGTWDSGISTTGGLIKNITVTGSFRGIFINHNSTHAEKVVLENVIIDGTTYTISCDQGMNQDLEATNSTFNGWTSYAATLGNAKFVDCAFGEGNGYAFCRPYAPTEFVGCDFEAGYTVDPIADVVFENCTIGGVALTAGNVADLVTDTAKATVK